MKIDIDQTDDRVKTTIAKLLTTSDLARMRAVNKAWKAMVDDPEIRRAAFRGTWGLQELSNEPRRFNFYLAAGLGHFVAKIRLSPRTTVASLVVKFRTDIVTLRVLNNCSSDFTLQSRPYIYVPVSNRNQLRGRSGTFTYDPVCGRQLIVLHDLASDTGPGLAKMTDGVSIAGTMDALARNKTSSHCPADTHLNLSEMQLSDTEREALVKKLSRQMGKGLNIDEGTASYYLDRAKGDMKKAFVLYKEDLEWETENPVGMLPLRARVPIPED